MRPVALGVRGLTSSPSALARGADHEPPLVGAKRCISWAGKEPDPGSLGAWKGKDLGPFGTQEGRRNPTCNPSNFLKTDTCNPLISEGLQVGLRPLSGAPKGPGWVGGGVPTSTRQRG